MDLKIAKRQAGFTLIEIIISIFIVTLLLGVATMSFQSIQEEGKLKNEGVAVKLAARKLMRQAVEKNQSYTMTLAPGFFATGPSYSNQSLETYCAIMHLMQFCIFQDYSKKSDPRATIESRRHNSLVV